MTSVADPFDPAARYTVAGLHLLRTGPLPARSLDLFRGVTQTGEGTHSIPFASTDHDNIRVFAEHIDRAFLPRPQGPRPAIAVGNRHPEISLPAAFEAFRRIHKSHGINLASTVQLSASREMTTERMLAMRDGENPTAAGHTRVSIEHLYHAGLWAAIRADFREGYNAEADHFIVTGDSQDQIARSLEAAQEAIRAAAGFTKFTTDTSRLFDYSSSALEEKFERLFDSAERLWLLSEFQFPKQEIVRMAVKFGPSLRLNEVLFDSIRQVKGGAAFDFEPSLDEAETLTTPNELTFYMHWLKARARPAQLVPPNLGFKKRQAYPATITALRKYAHHKMWPELMAVEGDPLEELGARISRLADVARHFDGTLSIHSGSGKQPEVLAQIGRATGGRFNYKISGELQLQLFDVLSEQPAGSDERTLYERMVARCEGFAARGAFGAESALAREYRGDYLGDARRGRVDGNLFLVFWLGNVIGSRDEDQRFFKEKLDELPLAIIEETRRRNIDYICWLATHLLN